MVGRRERRIQEAMIQHRRKGSFNSVLFVFYVIFGVYFLNMNLNFFEIPDFISGLNNWIFLLGGLLLIFSSIRIISKR